MTFATAQEAVVVDASAAMALLGGDGAWLDRWAAWTEAGTMILVPAHFPVEVANALLRGARLSGLEASTRLERLQSTGIEATDRGLPGLLGAVELADRHGLTVYDALYLDLALDIDASIATLDRELAAAARAEGVPVVS
ncbi:MAG: type II toxin-antitoxin system VapC family toxin [Chloroflexi bacterium]|nr:type II toxin-antitoxin system VapC family toxin [Chloroflexota bacterium]